MNRKASPPDEIGAVGPSSARVATTLSEAVEAAKRIIESVEGSRAVRPDHAGRHIYEGDPESIARALLLDIAPNLVAFVVDMAERSVKAILDGNEDEFRRYIGCERNAYTGRSEWHPIIHGTLFEHGAIVLRRKIVDTHRDLITSQRILDLEDQLTSVVAQHNKLKDEVEKLREERRYA